MQEPIEDEKSGIFRQCFRWLDQNMKARPFLTALIVMLLIVTPGFIRIEQNANTAQKAAETAKQTAKDFAKAEKRDDAKRDLEAIHSCQTRNTFQQNTRAKFDRFFDALRLLLLASSPPDDLERIQGINDFIDGLKRAVDTKPEDEDRDCNADGEFDTDDYLP